MGKVNRNTPARKQLNNRKTEINNPKEAIKLSYPKSEINNPKALIKCNNPKAVIKLSNPKAIIYRLR